MHTIVTIWLKELRDTIRDRRTLVVMVLVPALLTPALIVGISKITASSTTAPLHIAVAGGPNARDLLTQLRQQPFVVIATTTTGADATARVRAGQDDAALIVDPSYTTRIGDGGVGSIIVVSDSTQVGSSRAVDALNKAIGAARLAIVSQRLQVRHVDAQILYPIKTTERDVATKQALAGVILSSIVPMFLVIYALVGGMYTAMDISAGEKERFTLEALLLSPATTLQITLGKLLAVSTVALATVALALVALFIALANAPLGTGAASVPLTLPPGTIAIAALLGALLAVAFSSLELALGVFARSFKEAQNYITPLYLLAVVPVVLLTSIPGFKATTPLFVVPALNAVLLFKEALVDTPAVAHVVLTVVSMLVFCVLCIAVTIRIFANEKVLLRT